MKREVSFFRDRRATSAQAIIDLCHALGMTDEEIKEKFLKLRAEAQQTHEAQPPTRADVSPAPEPGPTTTTAADISAEDYARTMTDGC